jgi:hypothetical protein
MAPMADTYSCRRYHRSHLTWLYPGPGELSVTVDSDGLVAGTTHGHVVSSPDRILAWLAGQALGKQQVGLRHPDQGSLPPPDR